jgi:asparagine N-glycosylation enzyme membrane subunit Stt3
MKNAIISSIILVPLLIILMFIAPFSHTFSAGYPGFFEMIILCEIALFCGVLILYRSFYNKSATFLEGISYLLVLIIVTVLAFQIMLTFLIAVAIKFSGYPLWIPLIREGHRLFIRVG